MKDDLKPIGTTPQELANKVKIPAKVETPKPVLVPDIPDWKEGVGPNFWEKLRTFFQAAGKVATQATKVIADMAQITRFVETWWIPLAAMILIVTLLIVFKVL